MALPMRLRAAAMHSLLTPSSSLQNRYVLDISSAAGLMSDAVQASPFLAASSRTVPLPANGSRTLAPGAAKEPSSEAASQGVNCPLHRNGFLGVE